MRKIGPAVRLVLVLAMLTALAPLALSSPAAEELAPAQVRQASPFRVLTPAEALRQDARFYAADKGVSLPEAERRLRIQGELGRVIALLRTATEPRFAGAWIEHQPEYRVVVRLVGRAPAPHGLESAVAGSPVPVVFVTGARATLDQLLESIQASLPRLQAEVPGLAGTDVDIRTGEILLMVEAGPASEHAKARVAALAKTLGHPVRIETLDAPASDGHTRGGANLSTCTSGFVVVNGSGTRGVLTAGHCGDSQTYFEFGGTSYAMTFRSEIRDANQDVQWHTTTHDEYPEFYASSTTTFRTVTGQENRINQAVGDFVCHRGKTTGYSCGDIESTTYQPTYANACNGVTCSSVWIRVMGSSLKCYPGDSGGPWFLSGTAYGIYKGQSSSGTGEGQCSWAIYMAINYSSGLGVSLVLG